MTVVESMSAATTPTGVGSVTMEPNPVSLKTSQEILTSLHLIRDIRRLEKYQRDFFLKVKESLNQVHLLLDQQLMDMAWSDHLTDCEENLLKVSTHLQTTPSAQLAELYTILLRDREKLTARFQELSVKSSLSEFVVNSRALLDLHSVQVAAEAILNNEKPIPKRGDQSIPVDHTFFLANFCTASLASSMMASFVPRTGASSYQSQQQRSAASSTGATAYDGTKNLNGGLSSNGPDVSPSDRAVAAKSTQRALNQAEFTIKSAHPAPSSPRSQPQTSSSSGMHLYGEKFTEKNEATSANGMVGHELVAAITQIARRDDHSSTKMRSDPWTVDEMATPHGRTPTGNRFTAAPPTSNVARGNSSHDQNDLSSDDMSTTSEEAAIESGAVSSLDRSKPLSFARIASLNLEKQAAAAASKPNKKNQSGSNNSSLPTLQAAIADRQMLVSSSPGLMDQQFSIGYLPPTTNPRYFFDIAMDGKRLGRIIIEVEFKAAPKMAANFHALATSERGFGYRGCQFFQVWKNESVICGDWEHNSGRGGRAALEDGPLFTPDQTKLPCIRGAVGMRRMSKKHSSQNEVASQFRIILADMTNQFTGIFGHVVSNIEVIDRVADFGGEGGRPEKIALVSNCGLYEP